jgi:hypothetical protein
MARRHQQGWLKKEKRSQGETWVLFFRTVRKSDGKRESTMPDRKLLKLRDTDDYRKRFR